MDTTRVSLLMRVKDRNDTSAWREFDRIYRPMLHRFARECGLSNSDADDVVQQSMTTLVDYVERFEYDPKKGRFKGLLRTIAKNNVAKRMRKKRPQEAESQHFKRPQGREADPEEIFDRLWLNEHLAYCLKQVRTEVKESTYKAFVRYVLEEQPVEEICADLDITPNQVHKAKWRITQKIEEKLQAIVGETEL
jgi:RNA polymerase sigma-70 factor (ECF subfamily)